MRRIQACMLVGVRLDTIKESIGISNGLEYNRLHDILGKANRPRAKSSARCEDFGRG